MEPKDRQTDKRTDTPTHIIRFLKRDMENCK